MKSIQAREVWETVPPSGITYCVKCGVKIYKYWKKRKPGEISLPEMDKCANCFFKRK